MFPKNTDSLDIETNGSYYKSVTWIFVVTITLVIGSSILGAWDVAQNGTNQHLQQEDFELPFVEKNNSLEEESSEIQFSLDLSQEIMMSSELSEDCFSGAAHPGIGDVSVPEKGCFGDFDTAPGEMIIDDSNLPAPDFQFPLKVTNETIEDFWVVVGTLGGYSWVDGCIKVIQTKSNDRFIWDDIKGIIDINSVELCDYGLHGWSYYNLTFTIRGSHPIILDANHEPDSPLGDFWVEFDGTDLDKFVTLKVCTTWTGCEKPEQRFEVILAHKAMSQVKIPNSR